MRCAALVLKLFIIVHVLTRFLHILNVRTFSLDQSSPIPSTLFYFISLIYDTDSSTVFRDYYDLTRIVTFEKVDPGELNPVFSV